MPTSYTTLLGLAKPATGELSGTWGTTVNNYITDYVDSAVAGAQVISGTQTAVTLSTTNGSSLTQAGSGAAGSAQYAIIRCTGSPAGLLTITVPAADKVYLVINATSTSQSVKVVGLGPTTGVTVAASRAALIAWNGSDFALIATTDITKLSGTLAVANGGTGITSFGTGVATALGQNVTGSGGIVLSTSPTLTTPNLGTPSAATLSNATGLPIDGGTTGTLPVSRGGTGITAFGTGVATALGQNVTGSGGIALATSPTLAGSPTAPTQSSGTNNTTVATTAFVQAAVQTALQTLHPVGSIYINATNSTNPGTLLGFGTWTAFGAGRVPVGFNAANPLFDTAEETGGSADAIVVSHNHTLSGSAVVSTASLTGSFYAGKPNNSTGIVTTTSATIAGSGSGSQASGNDYAIDASHTHTLSGTTDTTGSSGTNANYQPYITVYMWKRTA